MVLHEEDDALVGVIAAEASLVASRTAIKRVRAEAKDIGGPWEPYDTTFNSDREPDDLPQPDEIIRDIQHHVAMSRGGTNTDVLVRDAVVGAPA